MTNTSNTLNAYEFIRAQGGLPALQALRAYGRHAERTRDKAEALEALGYLFIAGNNPRMNNTKKWRGFHLIRVAMTNSRTSGCTEKTLWAVKPDHYVTLLVEQP